MRRGTKGGRPTALAVAVCAILVGGCAQLNVPRIDPTGERIFAEPLVSPAPAYPGPSGASPQSWDRVDVVVGPRQTVAAVGSEVIVLAGVLGADDYLRTNERVEWTLEPGGAGQFVDLGRGTPMDLLVGDFTRPRIVNSRFAIGSTSRRYLRLTRGTATPADDVFVQSGQAWIAVTSPAEGISRVTAYAPNVYLWDRQRQTATIHWVDAQWCFPPPAINPAGTRHVLTTTVTRQTNQSPWAGWLVRYEILDGPAAGFSPSGARVIEVPTDSLGAASAEIFQEQPAPGTNKIGIQVIRPAGAECGAGGRLVVGSGTTLKTWSAPDVAVRKTGPAVASVGATLTFHIQVSNPGDLPAEDVTLTDVVPDGLTYLRSNPAGEEAGRSIRWPLGTLAAAETRSVEIDFRAERQGSVTNCAEVSAAGGLEARDSATTSVSGTTVDVQVSGPEQPVKVGEEVTFTIVITNRGQTLASGLLIKDRFDPGLEHAELTSPIERDLGADLAPGESQRIGVVLRVTRPGRWCNTVEVIAAEQVLATAEACLTAVEPSRPEVGPEFGPREPSPPLGTADLSVEMTGPEARSVGETAEFAIEITNTGDRTLTGLTVVANFDAEINPRLATGGHRREGPDVIWTFGSLPPGMTRRLDFRCDCVNAAARAGGRVLVTTQEGIEKRDEASLEIREAPTVGPANLEMTVEDRHDPIDAGKQKTFIVRVVNRGQTADYAVRLLVTLPWEMEVVKLTTFGPPSTDYSTDGRTVRFDPVDRIDPGESLEYRIRVAAKEPGDVRFRAELTSQSLWDARVVEEGTLINPAR